MAIAEIRHDVDMTDEYYSNEQDYYDENGPIFRNLMVSYQDKTLSLTVQTIIWKKRLALLHSKTSNLP